MTAQARGIAVFAEGSHHTDPRRRRDSFDDLWKLLLGKVGVRTPEQARIVGFSKDQLVAVCQPPKFVGCRKQALDLEIRREYECAPFERLVLAFDLVPRHNATQQHCRRQEVELLLNGLCERGHLPAQFLDAAAELREHYANWWALKNEASSRPGRRKLALTPPSRARQALDLLVMEPMFEALPLEDEKGFRDAIGLKGYPKGWPGFNLRGIKKPDQEILLPAFELAPKNVRIKVDKNDKHQIAEYVLRRLPDDSPAWRHPIVSRLRQLGA